jgi:hypothetical protein
LGVVGVGQRAVDVELDQHVARYRENRTIVVDGLAAAEITEAAAILSAAIAGTTGGN